MLIGKNSVKLNDFGEPHRLHGITTFSKTVFEAVRQSLYITVCRKVCGKTIPALRSALHHSKNRSLIFLFKRNYTHFFNILF